MKIKIALISLLFAPFLVFAQNGTTLPNAGLTPESSFYFLDRLGEVLHRFFTFSPESRARLEITFAKERIAEIKLILEDRGVSAKGLGVAEERLNNNLSRATAILAEQQQAGEDTGSLARELLDDFDPAREALKSIFKSEADTLDAKINELKAKLKEARLAGDATQVEALSKEVADLKAQKELLEQHEDKDDGDIEEENNHLDEALGLQKEAIEKIKDAEEEKADIVKEAEEDNLIIPDGAFKESDTLLSQAKTAFNAGNYEDAKRLAKEAKKNLKEVKKQLEKLMDAKDKEEDLNEEADIQEADTQKQEFENELKDADKEEAGHIREEMKQRGEELRKRQEELKDEQKQGVSAVKPCTLLPVGKLEEKFKSLAGMGGVEPSLLKCTNLLEALKDPARVFELDLSEQRLTVISSEMGKLVNLSELNLSSNQLSNLPIEIGNLNKLYSLDINFNQFTQLPTAIFNLRELESLQACGNRLTQLPRDIRNLTHLRYLHICSNKLTTVAAQLQNLSKLIRINLNDNPLQAGEEEKLRQLFPQAKITTSTNP